MARSSWEHRPAPPYIASWAFIPGTSNLQLGGTSTDHAERVVVETLKQLEAQMMMRHYEGFIRLTEEPGGADR